MSDDEREDGGYDNSHRALLQAFIARSVITQDELKPLWAEILSVHEERDILPDDVSPADLTLALSTLSAKLSPLDMELRLQPSQTDPSKTYHSIVNLTADPALTGLATTLSTDELAFFRRVLDKMFLKNHSGRRETCCVKGTDAVNCAKLSPSQRRESAAIAEENQMTAPKDITLVRAQEVLDELVEQKWLSRSRGGYYSLSPRGLLELREWLWETYNRDAEGEELSEPRVKSCVACRGILTVGERCDKRNCPTRLHTSCAARFWRAMQGQQKCPRCKTEWSGQAKVGELAIGDTTDGGGRGSMANGRGHGANGRARSTSSDEEESD